MKNLRDYMITIIGTIMFFGTQFLFDYLYDKSVDWKWIIMSTILFAIFEAFCQSQRNKKSDK